MILSTTTSILPSQNSTLQSQTFVASLAAPVDLWQHSLKWPRTTIDHLNA